MKIRYKKKNHYLHPGITVLIDWVMGHNVPVWVTATIVDTLSTQFTALVNVDGAPLTFRFYSDVGDTWRPV
jgi:hypothetical protein